MNERPFVKLLKTPFNKYAYDVNSNQMILLSDELYTYLDSNDDIEPSDSVKKQIEDMKNKGFFSSFKIKKIKHPETDMIKFHLDNNISQITLQVTQQCNFRCSYCPYTTAEFDNQREHSTKNMSVEVAKKSIDFIAEHSVSQENVSIGFYGGEPLLRFDLIREIVEYAEKIFIGKGVEFTVTTNGSLLTKEIVKYLFNHDFGVMVSLDGPPETHNRSRKFAASGKGTFSAVEKNLREIKKEYPDYIKKLNINVVIDPRYSANDIYNLFADKELYGQLSIQSTLIDDFFCLEKTIPDEIYLKEENIHEFKALMSKIGRYPNEKVSEMAKNNLQMLLDDINDKMKASKGLASVMAPGGPCIPGQRRMFVDVDGNLFPCERVSETSDIMKIGDIYSGIAYDKAEKLLNIGKLTEEKCRNCFAVRFCSLCAKNCDNNGELSAELKSSNCKRVRYETIEKMKDYIFNKEFELYYRSELNG